MQTSIRLTVTVYSPVRELTVGLCLVENGWFFVELSSPKIPLLVVTKSCFSSLLGLHSRNRRHFASLQELLPTKTVGC